MPPAVQQQSSSVSSDLVSKFVNPSPNTGIDSILNQNVQSQTFVNVSVSVDAQTASSDTTNPQTRIPILQSLQQTPESTATTTISITTLPDIPNFASLFQFDQWVSILKTKMSEFKQTNQFDEAISSIPGIVNNYLASKMKDTMDVAIQLQTNKLREEAQAENQEFLNQVDSTMKTIIKEQVHAQVSKIMSKIEKFPLTKWKKNKSINRSDIQKNLYNALVESYNSNKDIITSYRDVVTLKRCRDDQDKDEDPSVGLNRGSKKRRLGKEAESSKESTHKESMSTSSSKGATRSQPKSSGKSAHREEHGQQVKDLEDQSHQEFNTGNDDETSEQEALDVDESQWNPLSSPTPDSE
nr:hypothetical protein [Tanacetum cinerariifolium]GEY00817.1 hypothetical protein [Tanacetum cinerariifolium]GEY05680.1 hypothetical protein [Tanacetum cinerariifolium]